MRRFINVGRDCINDKDWKQAIEALQPIVNQQVNNVLAAFWTDLNPAAAGAVRIATLTDGSDTWIVVDWAGVREFSLPRLASFEIWMGVTGDAHPGEDISYAYGTIQGNGDGGFLSVGAENKFGNRGANTFYNGTGTLPANGTISHTGFGGYVGCAKQSIDFVFVKETR